MSVMLELNDTNLTALTDPGGVVQELGPGVVLVEGRQVTYGAEAAARARLKPKLVYDRHWQMLDREALGKPFRGLTRADMACAQLTEIAKQLTFGHKKATLVVPGTMNTQLPLLMGVAQGAGLPVNHAVDSAVAATSYAFHPKGHNLPGAAQVLVLDIQLHQLVATEVAVHQPNQPAGAATIAHGDLHLKPPPPKPSRLQRVRVAVDKEIGWQGILDRLARFIAGRFVQETRFDPLHAAATEQALYASLPIWLQRLEDHDRHDIALAGGAHTYSFVLTRAEIMDHLAEVYGRIAALAGPAASSHCLLLITHRLDRLPGLVGSLPDPVRLPPEAALAGAALAHQDGALNGSGIGHFTELPTQAHFSQEAVTHPKTVTAVGPAPTHYLIGGIARPIPEDGLTLDPKHPLPGHLAPPGLETKSPARLRWQGPILTLAEGGDLTVDRCKPDHLPCALKAGHQLSFGNAMQLNLIRVED